jgi:5-methylcytosine-specific restriction endonuclease McrA
MDYLRIEPHQTILVLNSDYNPINFTDWKRAICLLLKEKAQMLSKRVIRLLTYIRIPFSNRITQKPSRSMIYKRDGNKCQYCNSTRNLTIDHIIPKCRGGQDSWENLVVSCSSCNTKKGDKLLENTGMSLSKRPTAPLNTMFLTLNETKVNEWKDYIYV